MALSKTCIYFLATLVSLSIISCAEENPSEERSIASQIQQMIPDFMSGFSDIIPGFREARSPDHHERDHHHDGRNNNDQNNDERNQAENNDEEGQDGPQQRLFLSFPVWTTCNYTAQAGRTCPSCTRALTCYANNIGRLTICRGLFRYCNGGRCSLYPGSACNSTTI